MLVRKRRVKRKIIIFIKEVLALRRYQMRMTERQIQKEGRIPSRNNRGKFSFFPTTYYVVLSREPIANFPYTYHPIFKASPNFSDPTYLSITQNWASETFIPHFF